MLIESKYNLNQSVWAINKAQKKMFVSCQACTGTGEIRLADNVLRRCPVCYGSKSSTLYLDVAWVVEPKLTIGQIQGKVTNIRPESIFKNVGHYEQGLTECEFCYMAYETGIRSGTVYEQDRLFESLEKAQQECDRLNNMEPEVTN